MAINFLNTVDFNQNSLEKPRIENQPNDAAAGTGVVGQLYFDTTSDTLKQYVSDTGGGAAGWIEVGATSAVESIIAGTGIGVSSATGNVTVRNTGLVTVLDGTYIDLTKGGGGDNTRLQADLSAVDGTSTAADRFLTKANKWATIPFGDITEVQGGTYISVTNQTGPIPIVNHDATSRSNTASTASPGYGVSFTAIDSVTTNATGHVTATNLKTITLPADTNETYTLPVAAGASNSAIMNLTAGGTGSGVKSSVTVFGTTGRIAISEQTGNNGSITVDFPDDVTIVDDLTVGGVITQSQAGETNSFASQLNMNNNKLQNVKTGTASTDGVNLGQVELLVAGVGVFKGGYNATTDPGVPVISGGSNIALDQGDYFVVTHDGDITFSDTTVSVEVGDFIFANAAITASSTPASTQYTFVLADANVAGAGATDGATEKGVSGFDSANFTVSASGWVQLKSQSNANGRKQTFNNTAPCARVEANGLTTFTIDLADASLFGTGALAENVTAEITQNVSPYQTVYADVTRSGSASISVIFSGSVAVDIYRVLLTHV
jgi:hypothetical protein